MTIILFYLLGKRRKMAFKLDVEPLPELQYKILNQSFFTQLPPTPQAPTTIKIGCCQLSWVNNLQFHICKKNFSSSLFHYLSVQADFSQIYFFQKCGVITRQVILAASHLRAICCEKSSNICPDSVHSIWICGVGFWEHNIKKAGFDPWEQSHFWT